MRPFAVAILYLLAAGASACARLGFTDRVLHTVPSPDGRLVAVCQEVPVFDGPEFDIRLQRPDGTPIRPVAYAGDAYPCDEVVWSPDGRRLAVLNHGNSQITLIDIEEALGKPADQRLWNRTVTLTDSGDVATQLRFVSPTRIAYLSCSRTLFRASTTPGTCTIGAMDRRLELRRLSNQRALARNSQHSPRGE